MSHSTWVRTTPAVPAMRHAHQLPIIPPGAGPEPGHLFRCGCQRLRHVVAAGRDLRQSFPAGVEVSERDGWKVAHVAATWSECIRFRRYGRPVSVPGLAEVRTEDAPEPTPVRLVGAEEAVA